VHTHNSKKVEDAVGEFKPLPLPPLWVRQCLVWSWFTMPDTQPLHLSASNGWPATKKLYTCSVIP